MTYKMRLNYSDFWSGFRVEKTSAGNCFSSSRALAAAIRQIVGASPTRHDYDKIEAAIRHLIPPEKK